MVSQKDFAEFATELRPYKWHGLYHYTDFSNFFGDYEIRRNPLQERGEKAKPHAVGYDQKRYSFAYGHRSYRIHTLLLYFQTHHAL